MQKPLTGMNAAILVANGFNEIEMTCVQRALLEAGAKPHIVSIENSLVNGWRGNSWGLNHPVGKSLSDALAADYDLLVVVSGHRSHDKLKTTAHTRRFINGFMVGYKPVLCVGDALDLFSSLDMIKGFMVTGPEACRINAVEHGALWNENMPAVYHNFFSCEMNDSNRDALISGFINFTDEQYHADDDQQEAA